jgi:phi LC3 family holin
MNWKVRLKNKYFWISIIPALILIIESVAKCFGITLDMTDLQNNLIAVVNAIFVVLVIIGVVNDPTTDGLSDSEQAMTYETPKKDA